MSCESILDLGCAGHCDEEFEIPQNFPDGEKTAKFNFMNSIFYKPFDTERLTIDTSTLPMGELIFTVLDDDRQEIEIEVADVVYSKFKIHIKYES